MTVASGLASRWGERLSATVGNTWRFAVRIRPVALVISVAVLVAACGNASTSKTSTVGETDGITPTQIHVGALVAETGPLGDVYAHLVHGVTAYFDQINAAGGVNGRQLVITKTRDDATDPTRNTAQAQALVEDDHVFAVFASSPVFPGGTYLAQKGVPTFGTNFNAEWNSGLSLFGHNGSFNDPKALGPFGAWLAGKAGATTAAVIAYTVASSADCATLQTDSYKKFGIKVGLEDSSLPFGTSDVTADIQRIKDAHVGFVSTCMDPSGNTLVYTGLKKANLNNVGMYWPNGYDVQTLHDYASQMEGVYFGLQEVPFQDAAKSPEMQRYIAQMAKIYPGEAPGEESLYGWVVASLFVKGLQMAGPNPTRSSLVKKLNTITNWTGNGLIPRVDWTKQHFGDGPTDCTAVVQVQNGKFVPVFDTPDSPFTCFKPKSTTLDTIAGQTYSDVG
jgi:ABC-type branched-subunit amino acid transport system substrate-binding protein